MSVSKKSNSKRKIVDAAMTVVLLFLMAYQVTGEAAHEWIGVSMTILVIVHQILNRKWVSFVRRMHLSMSHWAFVLMGLHLGVHIPAMTAGLKWSDRTRNMLTGLSTIAAGLGLYLFIRGGMSDYLFFRVPFAFLDAFSRIEMICCGSGK